MESKSSMEEKTAWLHSFSPSLSITYLYKYIYTMYFQIPHNKLKKKNISVNVSDIARNFKAENNTLKAVWHTCISEYDPNFKFKLNFSLFLYQQHSVAHINTYTSISANLCVCIIYSSSGT